MNNQKHQKHTHNYTIKYNNVILLFLSVNGLDTLQYTRYKGFFKIVVNFYLVVFLFQILKLKSTDRQLLEKLK